MAVQNSLATQNFNNAAVEYKSNDETVKLSPYIVKRYLTNGNGAVSDQEVAMFINLCRYQHLNPFLREAYLIKYGSSPAAMVAGKEVFTKRARRMQDFDGFQAGIIVMRGEIFENRVGAAVFPNEKLLGGWAKVFIKGYSVPVEISVAFDEYAGRKADGTLNNQWSTKPATMIRKVALVQALREAFPEELQGMYAAEEVNAPDLSETPLEQPTITQPEGSTTAPPVEDELPFADNPPEDEEF